MPNDVRPVPTRLLGRAARWAAAAGVLLVVLSACSGGNADRRQRETPSRPPYSPTPNIVFVLTDDLSSDLLPYMPHVVALQRSGMTFTNYTVTDSLCCPSRATIFTGKYPHNTHVRSNNPRDGGMRMFRKYGGEKASFGYTIAKSGYRTALLGKYLNGYEVGQSADGLPNNYVPPGWTTWAAGAHAYRNFDYSLNENRRIVHYGSNPQDYLTSVIAQRGVDFISDSVADKKPFLLELSTYSPHGPFTPDPRDAGSFLNLKAPRGPSFDRVPRNAPQWMDKIHKLKPAQITQLDRVFVRRVESVQSVDRAIGRLESALRATGQLGNTVFVFSSDNGFHLGQHGLRQGKRTAFETDLRVPLVVAGPGIEGGTVNRDNVQNVDLAPTFEELTNTPTAAQTDGSSIVPLLHQERTTWRTLSLAEHRRSPLARMDPDQQPDSSGNPPTYAAIRGRDWTYVVYSDGSREYYDRRADPDQLVNRAGSLSAVRIAELDRHVRALQACKGATQCSAAGVPKPAR